jgi:putative redox protein
METSVTSPIYKSTLQYAGDEFFIGTSPGGHAHVIDVNGDRKAAPTPVELLMTALGGCTAADVISILLKKRQQITDYRVEVTGERREEHPRSFTTMNVHHIVYGHDVSEQALARAIELSETKYCSVGATLKAGIQVTSSYEIVEVDKTNA